MIRIALPFIETSQIVDASSNEVWRIMTDTSLWPRWGPSIRGVKCTDKHLKTDSTGSVQLFSGLWIKFVVTDFEEGRYWSWRMLGVHATGHRVEPLTTTHCRAVFEIPIIAAPYIVVCRVALKRISKLAVQT